MFSFIRMIKGHSRLLVAGIAMSCMTLPVSYAQKNTNSPVLSLSLKETERIFLEKNLDLLAQHYNIESSKALVMQARLWDDPVLNTDQNVYSNNKWFEHGRNPDGSVAGQYYIQLEQLIKTAGKRGKLIDMAQTNTSNSEWQFKQVMQELKFQLRSDYYTIAQLQALKDLYAEQQQQLDQLLKGMTDNYRSGNIAHKDLLRVQALMVSLNQSIAGNQQEIEDNEAELKTLLMVSGDTVIIPSDELAVPVKAPEVSIATLIDSAKTCNAAYQIAQLQLQYQNQNLAYQKSLKIPDITVGPNYDLNSNYAPHYAGLSISLPLPVFNGNRGNIQAARWQVKSEETQLAQADLKLQNNVLSAYNKYLLAYKLLNNEQDGFYKDYKTLQMNMSESFRQRQISLLEFIDYFNDYASVRSNQLQQQLNFLLAKETLNLQVGVDIF